MHDYELERLNTRSFEQLTQALGIEILGPQLMIFGDGPDGGREATFNGEVNYPTGKKAWNGYGMMQAKFRQKPDSEAKKNANWAIEQLKAEFAKLKPRLKVDKPVSTIERICPEYYIFATNLSLSPVSKSGGKDRVRALLDGFKKSHGLRDYAIWDGDQIRRFLDCQPGIRTTYTAWLLPGDVLSEMIKALRMDQTNFLSIIRRYLECELLDDQFARLGQGGYTDAKNIPLSSVFVDLPVEVPAGVQLSRRKQHARSSLQSENKEHTREQQETCTFLRLFFEEGRQVLKPSATSARALGEGDRKELVGRVVLIGGPGQGKTTVGQFACQLFRAALLRASGGAFSPEVSQALDRIQEMSDGLPVVNARRYPLRIDLKHLAASLVGKSDDAAHSLFDYLVKRISRRTNCSLRPEDFRLWLQAYPWLLVLDGLDEVPASSNRQDVLRAIRDFISVEAHDADADLLVLATTRPQGYSDEFDPSFYRHLPLASLDANQALDYGLRLAKARHPGQPTRVEELTSSLKRATTNSSTVRLMQSPLQVTIMLALIEGGGEPPEHRWKLFKDYYEVIYRREKERGTAFSVILGRYEPDIHWIHHRAGWLLQQRNAAAGATDARLTHTEFESIVDERLQKSGHIDVGQRVELVKSIRQAATDRLVLLVGNTEEEIGFEIRSLQEFMAAEHFFDGGESCVQKTLHAIAPYPYWRNVFLFAAGRVFFERQELTDCLIAVCGELNDTADDAAQRTIHVGSRLALALLRDGAARNQPGSIRVLARCGARALDARDGEAVGLFANLFNGEAGEVWIEELSKRLTTSGPSFPHQNWHLCLELARAGKPYAQEWIKTHFPWKGDTTLEFLRFILPPTSQVPGSFWRQLSTELFRHPPFLYLDLLHRGEYPKELHVPEIESLKVLVGPEFVESFPVVTQSGQATGNSFAIKGQRCLSHFAKLALSETVLRSAHPGWQVFQAVAMFARKPTMANLAEQLKVIARSDPDAAYSERVWYFPWQVASAMIARKAGHTWEDIITRVAAGLMGSESNWSRWEARNKKGIRFSRFRYESDWLRVSDDLQGSLLNGGGWMAGASGEQVFLFADEVAHALAQWPEIARHLHVIDLTCFGLLSAGLTALEAKQKTVAQFVNGCVEGGGTQFSAVILIILMTPLPIGEKIDLLRKVGLCPIKRGWLDSLDRANDEINKQIKAVIEELPLTPDWWAVLRAISFLPPLDSMQEIPKALLLQCQLKGEGFAKAAFMLRLKSLNWAQAECAAVVREALLLRGNYPEYLYDLFSFIDTKGQGGRHLEDFLVELLKQAPADTEPRLLERATALLVKLVERRPALRSLPDPATRTQARPL